MRLARLLTPSVGPFETCDRGPCGDLCSPVLDGPSEAANLDGQRLISEVADDLSDPLVGESGVAVGVCLTNDFLSDNRPSGSVVSGVR